MKNDKLNKGAANKGNTQRRDFIPSTREELNEYARRAAVREEQRKQLKLQNLK